ncbi:unnamed protein product, partial [Rotaria magnacalcarata]
MLNPYDKNGKEIPFQGIRYCTDNDACQCKRCKKNRMNEWPYERSLSANLLYLTGLHINDINYMEVIKFEETLVSDYLRHIGEFWKYVTELCLLAGEHGNSMNINNIDYLPHWDELLSETELQRIREENKWNHIQQQQQPKKKRRCFGNRKIQRFRKACRRKGLSDQMIKMLIEMRQPLDRNTHNKNRQDHASTWNSSHMINISIDKNQNQPNKCQINRTIPSSTSIQPMKVHRLSKEDWRQSSKLIPNYNRLSPNTFKQLILKHIPTTYHDQIQQCLAPIKLLKCVRQLANLWCHFFQLKIEEDYCNYVGNLNTSIMDWLSEDVSKEIIQQHSIDWDCRKTKSNIQYQTTLVQNKLQQTEYNILKHLCQLSSKFDLK